MEPLKIIKQALDSATNLVKKGSTPTAALTKVARDYDLNANYIQRTGEMLNVALHYNHFKTASDRSADFDTADIGKATAEVFGEEGKTSIAKKAEYFPTTNVKINYNNYHDPVFLKMAAQIVTDSAHAANETYDMSLNGAFEKAANYVSKLERNLDVVRTEKVGCDISYETSFFGLVGGFKKTAAARTPFHEFESQAYAIHGDTAVPYLDLIYKSANLDEPRGQHDAKYLAFDTCKELTKLSDFFELVDKKQKLAEELVEAEDEVAEAKDRYKVACFKLHPEYTKLNKIACENMADELDSFLEKEAFSPITTGLLSNYAEKFNKADPDNTSSPLFKNTQTENRSRAALLEDLIMTDPILANQDANKVIKSYQQLLRLAPHLSSEKEVVRAQLRGMTAGQALAPVDANQLVEANTSLMKQKQLMGSMSTDSPVKK